MAFLESPRFPDEIAYWASIGPQFRTEVAAGVTGYVQTNPVMPDPLHAVDIAGALREMDIAGGTPQYGYKVLRNFFMVLKGRANGFRIKNFWDYQDEGLGVLGTGTGSQTVFQIVKRYTVGALTMDKTIYKPVAGTVGVLANGVVQATGWTVNTTNGKVTFTVAPANGVVLTCTFQFDLPMMFDRDGFRVRPDPGGLAVVESLTASEYRPV